MMPEDLARLTHARREGSKWRGRCPVHQPNARYGRSLAIYADTDRVGLHCFSGCSKDDVLSALGLTWKDTLYEDQTLSPEEKREWAKKKAERENAERWRRADEIWAFLRATYRTKRPVTLTDLQHACFDARMESYFKEIL